MNRTDLSASKLYGGRSSGDFVRDLDDFAFRRNERHACEFLPVSCIGRKPLLLRAAAFDKLFDFLRFDANEPPNTNGPKLACGNAAANAVVRAVQASCR